MEIARNNNTTNNDNNNGGQTIIIEHQNQGYNPGYQQPVYGGQQPNYGQPNYGQPNYGGQQPYQYAQDPIQQQQQHPHGLFGVAVGGNQQNGPVVY